MLASYYCFDVEIHAEFPGRVAISKREIVGGVVRDHDLVAKLNIAKFLPGVFVGDSQKVIFEKISHYMGEYFTLLFHLKIL